MLKDEFLKFCNEVGFKIESYQLEIMELIFDNIDKNYKTQVVFLPEGAGKTAMSLLLTAYLQYKDEKASIYSYSDIRSSLTNYSIFSKLKRSIGENTFLNPSIAFKKIENSNDFIIVDEFADIQINDYELSITNKLYTECQKEIGLFFDKSTSEDFTRIGFIKINELSKDSFLIIFDTKKNYDNYACSSLIKDRKPIVIDYFPGVDKYVTSYEKTLRSYNEQNSINKTSLYDESIKAYFDEKFNQVNNRLDSIENKIDQIRKTSNDIQKEVAAKKFSISTFVEYQDDQELIDDFTNLIVSKINENIGETIKTYEKFNSYQQFKKVTRNKLGEDAWNKMSEDSKRFVVTAKFTFAENMLLEEDIDYSSICLLISKAFEIELSKRLVTNYQNYLKNNLSENCYDWPEPITKVDRKGKVFPLSVEDFTLGSSPYIFGILPRYGNEVEYSREWFRKYAKQELFNVKDDTEMIGIINDINEQIMKIKNSYRNPAAHKNSMSMMEASECLDYVLEVERVLKRMLEMFVI